MALIGLFNTVTDTGTHLTIQPPVIGNVNHQQAKNFVMDTDAFLVIEGTL